MDAPSPRTLTSLTPSELAQTESFVALAALAHPSVSQDGASVALRALTHLSEFATDQEAFELLWTVLDLSGKPAAQTPQRLAAVADNLTDGVTIPERFCEDVQAFVLSAAPPRRDERIQNPQLVHARSVLALAVLSHLDASAESTLSLAIEVVQEVGSNDPRWLEAAKLLAYSGRPRGWNTLLDAISGVSDPSRALEVLSCIPVNKRRKKDWDAITDLLKAGPAAEAQLVGRLIREMPPERAIEVVSAGLISSAGDDYLDQLRLADADETLVRALLESDQVPSRVKQATIKAGGYYDIARFRSFGPYLFSKDPSAGAVLVGRQLDRLNRVRDPQQAAELREALAEVGSAGREQAVAETLGSILEASEMFQIIDAGKGDWEQIGAIVQGLQRRDDLVADELPSLLYAIPSRHASDVTQGLLAPTERGLSQTFVQTVARWAIGQPAAQLAMLEVGRESDLVDSAVEEGSRAAFDVVVASGDRLSAESLATLTSIASWKDATDGAEYESFLTVLSSDRGLLATEATKALRSLSGPEVNRIRPDLLVLVLRRTIEANWADDVAGVERPTWDQLLKHRDQGVVEIGCEFFAQREPSEEDVEAVAHAHETSARLEKKFEATRHKQAAKLSVHALDEGLPIEERKAALELSAKASVSVAREAALTLLGSLDTDLRKVAADILGREVPNAEELEALHALSEHEPDREVLNLIQKATRRAESGDVAEAMRNLYSLVDLDENGAPTPAQLGVPPELFDLLTSSVDAVRMDRNGPLHNLTTSIAVLVDLLVEIAAGLGGKVGYVKGKDAEFDALLTNAPEKPEVGTLLKRQELVQKFSWFGAAREAHELRRAHAAAKGSTRPWSADEIDHAYVLGLLKRVVMGWTESLREFRRLGK